MLLQGALVAAIGASSLLPASAVTYQFCSFSYNTAFGQIFAHYDNASGVLSGVNVPVKFNYVSGVISGVPVTGFGSIDATLTFHAVRKADASGNVNGPTLGRNLEQAMTLTDFSLISTQAFTVRGVLGKHNLLSGSAGNALDPDDYALLAGRNGGATASLDGSISGGTSVVFSSDFIDFHNSTDADFKFNFDGINPTFRKGGLNLLTFNAQLTGQFGVNPAPTAADVPEPGSVALVLGLAGPASLLAIRSRRRRK